MLQIIISGVLRERIWACVMETLTVTWCRHHRVLTDGPLPSVMQKVPVPVITNSECEVMYRNAGYIEDIPNIFICAGYESGKRDSCEVRSLKSSSSLTHSKLLLLFSQVSLEWFLHASSFASQTDKTNVIYPSRGNSSQQIIAHCLQQDSRLLKIPDRRRSPLPRWSFASF